MMAEVNKFPGREPAVSGGKSSLPPGGEPPYGPGMEARLAVLEQIAATTRDALVEIKAEMRELRTEVKAEIGALRTEIKGEINALRTEIKEEISELRTEMRSEFRDVRVEMKELRQDQKTDFRIMFGALIAATLGLASLIGGLAAIMAHGFKWF
jgi:chromosome segregation ATPase